MAVTKYKLDMTKPHAQSLIELINHDNADTIGTPLTLSGYELNNERAIPEAEQAQHPRTHGITVQNKNVAKDNVEVYWNKVAVTDVVSMTSAGGDFNWYNPDDWEDATSPAQAIVAFKAACTRDGIDPDNALGQITVERTFDQAKNHFYLTFSFSSHVFLTGAKFEMPKHFSEIITVKDLVGFIYEPIKPEDVVE